MDGTVLVCEKPDQSTTSYVYGIGMLYEVDDTTGDTTYYHFDNIGSTAALTDATGSVTDRIEYDPYGAVTHRTGTTETPFLYVGEWGGQQDANGLLHMRARYYSPELRRFINADPIRFSGGMNWYAYAGGDPIMGIDPMGFDVVYMVDSSVIFGAGHAASAVGSDATYWTYYSYGSGTSVGTSDNLDVKNYSSYQDLIDDNSRYDLQVSYPTNPEQDRAARREGNSHYGDSYNIFTRNCDDVAAEIIRATGQNFDDAWWPVKTYELNTLSNELK